jgi:predicted restriction endonuclease
LASAPEVAPAAAAAEQFSEERDEAALRRRRGLDPGVRDELLRARRGLGSFRQNVEKFEQACRVTGLLDRRHLRATHIKPWRDADDGERLDGENGLLLSPHVSHLFERGYISFGDDGELLVSRQLNPAVFEKWGLASSMRAGAFTGRQRAYLAHHRQHVFEQPRVGRRR